MLMRVVIALVLGLTIPAAAQNDSVARGEQHYAWCSTCHSLDPTEEGLQGPNLYGIVGSPAGSEADFPYSQALIRLREQGLVWDATALDAFLTDPLAFAPNNSMGFFGIDDPIERTDLIAYLIAVSEGG